MVTQVGRGARALLTRAEGLIGRAEDLLAQPDLLRAVAREQVATLTRRQVRDELRARPIVGLREVIGGAAKLDAVHDAGYRTLDEVIAAAPDELTAIPGIGLRTADRIHTAALAVADGLPVRPDSGSSRTSPRRHSAICWPP